MFFTTKKSYSTIRLWKLINSSSHRNCLEQDLTPQNSLYRSLFCLQLENPNSFVWRLVLLPSLPPVCHALQERVWLNEESICMQNIHCCNNSSTAYPWDPSTSLPAGPALPGQRSTGLLMLQLPDTSPAFLHLFLLKHSSEDWLIKKSPYCAIYNAINYIYIHCTAMRGSVLSTSWISMV